MRWNDDGGGLGPDIEDRRGEGGGGGFGFGGGGLRLGCGGIILLGILSLIFKQNFFALLAPSGGGSPQASVDSRPVAPPSAREDERARFVNFVVNDVQKTWDQVFPSLGATTRTRRSSSIATARAPAAVRAGPDGAVLLSERPEGLPRHGILRRARAAFRSPGDFAQAYVIAHEFGHHVQTLLGIEGKVRQAMEQRPSEEHALSVRLELQADCLAGVWGHGTAERNILENGDVEKGLAAAAAVGDDRLQRAAGQRVNPESWTHGSASQRTEWFTRGLKDGTVAACDTFKSGR